MGRVEVAEGVFMRRRIAQGAFLGNAQSGRSGIGVAAGAGVW